MEDDLDAAEDERTIELSSIAAIYPELLVDPIDPHTATLDVPVTPEKPLKIWFRALVDGVPPAAFPTPPTSIEAEDDKANHKISLSAAAVDVHELSHLPPLTIRITLPDGYPAEKPPDIHLSATPDWIPNEVAGTLTDDCKRLWEEMGKDQVVYTYIDHLQQAAEQAFNVAKSTGEHFHLPGDLKLALLDFDLKTKRELFERGTFECGICLEPKKGAQCHRLLLCAHVFCVQCLSDFYNSCISEGDVDNVKCLSPECGKDENNGTPGKRKRHDRTLNPSELLQIPLDQETVQRYVRLKRKKKLESDKNTVYCPRQWCQGAARSKKHPKPADLLNDAESSESEAEEPTEPKKKKSSTDDIPMSERLCVCEDCNFAFCSVCKKGWHGELARCNPRRQTELNEEEKASMEYLKRFSTPCPTCNAPSQKTHGCNHMICFKCRTHFCYLCSSYLMPDNPYRHFNDFKSPCYMRLWELEGGDGADVGIGYGGGAGNVPAWEPEDSDTDSDDGSDISDEEDDFDFEDEDDTDDEEPAPDQRRPNRNMHIELVNFAGNGANRRIELPQRPRAAAAAAAAPPPVPNPPRRRGRGQEGNRQQRVRQEPQRRARPGGQPVIIRGGAQGARVDVEPRNLPNAAPGQGNGAQLPAGIRAMGLERFLELAQQDLEDEWDSDELDEDMPAQPEPPRRQRGR